MAGSETPAPPARRRPWQLLVVVALFVAPIGLAWLYVHGWLDWRARGSVVHGALLEPPVDVRRLPAQSLGALCDRLEPGEWAVLYLDPTGCDGACRAALDRLETVHLLLGHTGERVALAAFVGSPSPGGIGDGAHAAALEVDPAAVAAIADSAPSMVFPAVAFMDWRGQLMMHFPATAPQADILKDLRRLLRASEIR